MELGTKNIVLVGFMGTGKSAVGKALAKKLRRPLVDIDRAIERQEKRKIREIFEKDGEPHFRALEKEVIRSFVPAGNAVVTTGGGAVIDPENFERLKAGGILVTLSARPETIHERVRRTSHRPLLKNGDILAEIRRLLEIRKPFYAKSDLFFETDGRTAAEVAGSIIQALTGDRSKV